MTWLRAHPVFCGVVGSGGIAAVFFLDMAVPGYLLNGLYVLPLFFLALSVTWRAVVFAVAMAVGLSALVFVWEGSLNVDRGLVLLYAVMIGLAFVMLAYLFRRLATTTEYAVLRAQLSEAGADILGGGRSRKGDDLDHGVGVMLHAKVGDPVSRGDPVATLYHRGATGLEDAVAGVAGAVRIAEAAAAEPLVIETGVA